MNRLTKKDRYGHFYTNKALCRNIHSSDGERFEGVFFKNQVLAIDGKAIDKLGKLEDIEEELGIELITLFKALKYGVYYFDEQGQLIHDYVYLTSNFMNVGVHEKLSYSFLTYSTRQTLLFENYGKTRSVYKQTLEAMDETKTLSKEELKNEQRRKVI